MGFAVRAPPASITSSALAFCACRHREGGGTAWGGVERLLGGREDPPEDRRRVPGPRALLYYLHRDAAALALDVPLPRSTRTIWKVLRRHGRIAVDAPRRRQPLVRPAPLEEVHTDVKAPTPVPPAPGGKQQQWGGVCDTVRSRTSLRASVR